MIEPYFRSLDRNFTLLHGDCRKLLRNFDFKFNCIFADPPYFLSKGGISIQSGKIVCVNKGDWDKGPRFRRSDYGCEPVLQHGKKNRGLGRLVGLRGV